MNKLNLGPFYAAILMLGLIGLGSIIMQSKSKTEVQSSEIIAFGRTAEDVPFLVTGMTLSPQKYNSGYVQRELEASKEAMPLDTLTSRCTYWARQIQNRFDMYDIKITIEDQFLKDTVRLYKPCARMLDRPSL